VTSGDQAPVWQSPRRPIGSVAGLAYGGFWIRTLAYLIDALILTAIGLAISLATGVAFVTVQTQQFRTGTFTSMSIFVGPTLPGFLIYLVYFAGLWALRGQTIGMALFGLRILRASDGSRIGPGRAVGRFFGLLLSFFVFLIGVIWVAADARKQGWHDKLARTVVVRPARAETRLTEGP
jgi:uncharacterized RDD family membrane protein YckC